MGKSQIARRRAWRRFVVSAAAVAIAVSQLATPVVASPRPVSRPSAPSADALVNPTSTIVLDVQAARTEPRALGGTGVTEGQPVDSFKWIINLDNTGTTAQRTANAGSGCSPLDPSYPDSCE